MDQREKINDGEESLRAAITGLIWEIKTCFPVEVVSWDPVSNTVSAQPVLPSRVEQTDGTYLWPVPNPMIHCPVVFMGGGGWTATFPLKKGNEALAIFSARSIDEWLQAGGVQSRRADLRAFSISDGFILVGPRSTPNLLTNINTEGMELRSDDGLTKITLTPGAVAIDGPTAINATSATKITLTAPIVNIVGVLQVGGVPVTVP